MKLTTLVLPPALFVAVACSAPGVGAPASIAAAVRAAPVFADASASAPAAPVASASAATPEPKGKVANIGMHIGGGPNDDVTKEPIRKSVEPHFDDFRRCYALALADDADAKGDVGVDLLIPRDGGRAEVGEPRLAIKSAAFRSCVVDTFKAIDFRKPRGGLTKVSYSLRFTPR